MNKILTILAALCAIACTSSKTTIYDFSAETNSGEQFGHQEPGTNAEIEEFCRLNHGVTFPLMAKSDVNGEKANEVFKWLYSEKPFTGFGDSETGKFMDGMLSKANPDYASNPDIKWNFTKFLIDRKGRVVARFEPVVTPEQIVTEIEALL